MWFSLRKIISPIFHIPSLLLFLCEGFKPIKCNSACLSILGNVAFHCRMIGLSRATFCKQSNSPFPSTYQLPISPQPRVTRGDYSMLESGLGFRYMILWILSLLLFVHMCIHPFVSRKYCSLLLSTPPQNQSIILPYFL